MTIEQIQLDAHRVANAENFLAAFPSELVEAAVSRLVGRHLDEIQAASYPQPGQPE